MDFHVFHLKHWAHILWQWFHAVPLGDEITLLDIETSSGEELQLLTVL